MPAKAAQPNSAQLATLAAQSQGKPLGLLDPRKSSLTVQHSGDHFFCSPRSPSGFFPGFKTRDIVPVVRFASRGSLLPGKTAAGLLVVTLNVDKGISIFTA